MDHRRVGRQFRRRAGLAVAGDRAEDQLRIDVADRGIVELEPAHHAGAEILHQHVGGRDQPAHGFDAGRRLQVEHEAVLADIELAERRRAMVAHRRSRPHRLALGGFDLDHLRAHVGEHPRAMRSGDRGRKIEHAKAVKAPCQIPLIVGGYCRCQGFLQLRRCRCSASRDPKVSRPDRKASRPDRDRGPSCILLKGRLDPILHSPVTGWNEGAC
ncbi:hypothetical protein ACVWY2_009203 [Bradyrhizobium sp. JR6.1]